MATYKFYMQECDNKGNVITGSTPKDLENDFKIETNGLITGQLRYKECKGLNTIGGANVFSESYADSERLRVYVPTNLTHKPTTVELTLYFTGEDRYKVYDSFNQYLKESPFHIYYDSARKKKLAFFIKDEIATDKSLWYGSNPYVEVVYKLDNIFGKTFDVE